FCSRGRRPRAAVSDRDYRYRLERSLPAAPQTFRNLATDSGQQSYHAFECDLIPRIGHEANERGDVFNVRLFEKANATGDLIRNSAKRKFELQLHRVILRAIEQGDL